MSWKKYLIPLVAIAFTAGCSFTGTTRAPILDGPTSTTVYKVQKGDTLYSIARRYGVDPKTVARENGITNPTLLTVGQRLRINVSGKVSKSTSSSVKSTPVATTSAITSGVSTSAVHTTAIVTPTTTTVIPALSDSRFTWPVEGKVLKGYGDNNKGVDIAVAEDASVNAAGDGQVLFVGSVRGYGNLVIVKHDATYVTAYGHNKSITVKHGQSVKRGQKIAVAGKTDTDPARIHFEIRKNGKPIDPTTLLPVR